MSNVDRVNITKKLPPKKSKQELCVNSHSGSSMTTFYAELSLLSLAILFILSYT